MEMRARVKEELRDLRDGWNAQKDEPGPFVVGPAPDFVGKTLGGISRVALFGFLLARPGVPFLPQDNSGALLLTLLAWVVVSPPLKRFGDRYTMYVAIFAFVLLGIVIRMDAPSTSIVLIGSLVAAVTNAARSYPFVYGFVVAVAGFGVAIQVFNWEPFHEGQSLLSGRPWTPDRAGHELLLFTAVLFLTALMNVSWEEMERFKSEAEAAKDAPRDGAISDERARIARELHDVVSHHVTAMTLQAEAAAMTGDKEALGRVASAGREALGELRRMLGVLRRPSDDDAGAATEPQPGLADLQRLTERARSGLEVHIDTRGAVRDLPAGLELCVYRVVQEALTNSAKHGDASRVEVLLHFEPTMITVDIKDNGRPLATPRVRSGGLGLVGMQERVSLLNGELTSGPRTDAIGYEVTARLPIDA